MLINGFTVCAQAINFLILVWLLKRFLYKPILSAIDAREQGIAAQLADAVAKMAEAHKERDDFQHKNEAFDKERAALLKKANDDASAEGQRLVAEATRAADALRTKRNEALQVEQANLGAEIVRWAREEVFAITRKTLADLSGVSLEERMSDVFVDRLHALAGPAKDQMATAFNTSNHTVSVHSAFDLPPAQRTSIEAAVRESFAPEAHVQFETAPELVSGIELSTNGHKIAWSIGDYLANVEKSAAALVRKNDASSEAKPGPASQPKPRPAAKVEPKPAPKRDVKNGPVSVASASKGDH
jgi:F-type H+-transporting ATPase subunit b